ncbi:hypothetical protein [Streptosporangium sp. NBC_01756]|nr:hypothetical protein [Streptosporangium sp. NBC_01756]WSC84826.1 hypothetical protein OIE48_31280 [Streptosporangium sp. NBC_01756]
MIDRWVPDGQRGAGIVDRWQGRSGGFRLAVEVDAVTGGDGFRAEREVPA